jgi:SAM-dependent methyltransferase
MNKQTDEHELIREHLRERVGRGDNSGYDELYRSAKGDPSKIPWADLKPNANVTAWLDRELPGTRAGAGQRALVIGCGLGDDAEELSRRGFAVTAFDIARTAIEWCRKRFRNSRVSYVVANLLEPPTSWPRSFDFVLESYTIQAMSLDLRERALRQVADFVAPRGRLLIVCRARDEPDPPGTLPYPLALHELDLLRHLGLKETSVEDFMDTARDPPIRRFRVSYRRGVA